MKKWMKIGIILLAMAIIIPGTVFLVSLYSAKQDLSEVSAIGDLVYSFDLERGDLQITLETGEAYAGIVRSGITHYVTVPLVAIWAEDLNGNYLSTFYVSDRLFQLERTATLPVYLHKINQNGIKISIPDAVSSASTEGLKERIQGVSVEEPFVVYMECNRSYDYNEIYAKGLKEADPGYNTDYSGQPSLIYSAIIDTSKDSVDFELIGHGSSTGKDGLINPDLNGITTADDLFSAAKILVLENE